jgi:Ca2+-binding EF-hand superfamily protein
LSGWQFLSLKRDSGGHATTKNLPGLMKKLRGLNEVISEEEIAAHLSQSYPDADQEIEFESFLRVQLGYFLNSCWYIVDLIGMGLCVVCL